ncbi:MAG: hypothetical protein JW952_06795, partial [Candidatus Eisenbacteria bacterium]|nr:hypothetical protein [Candidatus Eisenbacteria bacterium]
MRVDRNRRLKRFGLSRWMVVAGACAMVLALAPGGQAQAGSIDAAKRLKGFDAYMQKILKDWNAPG